MAEMTPEREAEIGKLLGFHRIYGHEQSRRSCQWCEVATELLAALRAERDEVAAYAVHEEQTHRILGAILGVDDSLEACARRMKERAERAERERDEYQRKGESLCSWIGVLLTSLNASTPEDGVKKVEALTREVERLRRAVWTTHVPVTGTQHDPARGLIHGCCERCRMPWPCDYSPERALTPPAPEDG